MISLIQLSPDDDRNVYEMLQRIKLNENEFTNSANGLNYESYKKWLIEQDNWSKGIGLPSGYVPQTIYWLYDERIPVGMGKIRHRLTQTSRIAGGNIGYAIDPTYRGRGYGNYLLEKLIQQSKIMGIEEILLTVIKSNLASRAVIEKNGGKYIGEKSDIWYFKV